jgi:hypothetical protein
MLGVGTMGVLVVYGLASMNGDEPKPEPTGGTELCVMLRDSQYDNFSTGTWERLTDWPKWKIRRYVADRCPEQLDRFL